MTGDKTRNHEQYMRRACELAREAKSNGNNPFGSLLVHGDEVIMEEQNHVNDDGDIALHPELTLARRAASELDPETISETVMYTSTEPCAMCSTGISFVGFKSVIYSVSLSEAVEIRGNGTEGIPSEEVFDRYDAETTLIGPVLSEEGKAILEEE